MKAILKPLDGKYYGTIIVLDFEDGGHTEEIKLWDNTEFEPSKRELELWGYTQEQWDSNAIVEGFELEGEVRIWDIGLISDNHYESKLTYERAIKIVSLLNGNSAEKQPKETISAPIPAGVGKGEGKKEITD